MLSLNTSGGRDINIIFSYKSWHYSKKSESNIEFPYSYFEFAIFNSKNNYYLHFTADSNA